MSVCSYNLEEHPTACRFGSGAYSYFRLSFDYDSYDSSPGFTRPPSLAPCPPCSWQTPESILTNRLRRSRRGTLSGRFRRFLTDSATAHRLWVTEHPVSFVTLLVDKLTINVVVSHY
jgi:hypothetical protein